MVPSVKTGRDRSQTQARGSESRFQQETVKMTDEKPNSEGNDGGKGKNGTAAPDPVRGSKEDLANLKRRFHDDLLKVVPTDKPEGDKPGGAPASWWGQLAAHNGYRLSIAMQAMEALVERMSECLVKTEQEVRDLKIELGKTNAQLARLKQEDKKNQKNQATSAPKGGQQQQAPHGSQGPSPTNNQQQPSYSHVTGQNAGPPGSVFHTIPNKQEEKERKRKEREEAQASVEIILLNVPMEQSNEKDKESMMSAILAVDPEFNGNTCAKYSRQFMSNAVPKPINLIFKTTEGRDAFYEKAEKKGYADYNSEEFWLRKGRTRTERSEKKHARDKWFKKTDQEKKFLQEYSGKF